MNYCPICGDYITDKPSMYAGRTVHPGCLQYAESDNTALEYAMSYPADFAEFLKELLICTDFPEDTAAAQRILRAFRDDDAGGKDFSAWCADN